MTPAPATEAVFEELTRAECLALAASHSIGRLAVAMRAGSPLVVPINYVVVGEFVEFRTAPGSKLTALRERPVSFQVDEFDPVHQTGWSVLIQGMALETSHPSAGVEVEPWAPGRKDIWVRITPASISGRRITVPLWPVDGRAYL